MTEKGTQAIFITGKFAEVYHVFENEYKKQTEDLTHYLDNQIKPINDLWVAVISQAIGKIAKSVENNDYKLTYNLILKFIVQMTVWLDFLDNNLLEETTLKENEIHNPSFNTILVKLIGELSRETLRNSNSKIQVKIATIRSFCDLWLERFKVSKTQLVKERVYSKDAVVDYWDNEELEYEDLPELFSEIDQQI
ncbi:MAG: hypothetical protein FK733_15470 [Asgard group archaeon]|nr:hypothetical protein [Asgard group archaeon]